MKYDFETVVDRCSHGASKWMSMLEKHPETPKGIVPLSVADMEFKNAPEIINGLKNVLDNCLLGYAGPTAEYYQSVIDWMKRRHQFDIRPEWIVTTPGVVTAIRFILRSVTSKGDGVILLTPVYYPFFKAVEGNECQVVASELLYNDNYYQIDFDDLQAKAEDPHNTALILCSPHNPIGRVWTETELRKIADICLANHVTLISDEIHHDLIMPGYKHHVLAGLDERYAETVITCTSCSKSFNLAGLKVSNIIIKNKELRTKIQKDLNVLGHGSLNVLGYKACLIAYNEAEPWLEACLKVIYDNSLYLKEFIARELPMINVVPLEGTYLQWLDCRALKLCDEDLEQIMTAHYLYLDEGYIFGDGGKGFERVNLACPRSVLVNALDRFKAAVESACQ
ncbi:MAG: MalY/PatB family protein [Erysipelotrichaceae bacterium]|nr:MalY/PatB family protein [Erysipelotrichaceae bacterium]